MVWANADNPTLDTFAWPLNLLSEPPIVLATEIGF